jgi:hypothetical protein
MRPERLNDSLYKSRWFVVEAQILQDESLYKIRWLVATRFHGLCSIYSFIPNMTYVEVS